MRRSEPSRFVRPTNRTAAQPFAPDALVPYKGRVVRIQFRAQPQAGVYCSTLHDRDSNRNVAYNVPHAALLLEFPPYARYSVGDQVALAYSSLMTIFRRQWDFRTGTVWYFIAHPNRTIPVGWLTQERVMELDRMLAPSFHR